MGEFALSTNREIRSVYEGYYGRSAGKSFVVFVLISLLSVDRNQNSGWSAAHGKLQLRSLF